MEQKQDEQKLISRELDSIIKRLSWKQLNKLIHDFSSLRETVSAGGIRIQPKNRKIIIPAVKKKCLENGMILYRLFTSWFNEQKEYYDCLAPFFQSEEHDELLEEREIDSWKYVVSDEYFDKFIGLVRPDDIDKFLLLSPVCFTSTQKGQLEQLRNKQGETGKALPQASESETKKRKQADGVFLSKGEWKHHQKELKKSKKAIEKLTKENSRLHNRQKEHNKDRADLTKQIDEIEVAHAEEIKMLDGRQESLQLEIAELESEISRMASRLIEKNNRIRNLEKAAVRLEEEKERYFHQILSRLDAEELLSSLNAPDDVLELLSTVIRPPATDDADRQVEASVTLHDFWNSLAAKENELVQDALKISVEEVARNKDSKDWLDREDNFIDLRCSLSTRIYLADMIHRIFQQYHLSDQG